MHETDPALLSRKPIHEGRVVRLSIDTVRLPNGRTHDLEMIRHPGAAAVVPILPDGTVLLVRQYRWATGGTLLEVPAGQLDPGEPPEACALREVEEETGYRAGRLETLGWIWTTPGFTDEKIWLYAARDLEPGRQRLGEHEVLEVERIPLARAVEMAKSGEIVDGKSVAALFRVGGG